MNLHRRLGLLAAGVVAPVLVAAAPAPSPVSLSWLGQVPPTAADGVSWGVPWPQGQLQKSDHLVLTTAAGHAVPLQSWPLAYWPDGSVKWSGQAIATATGLDGPLQLGVGPASEVTAPLTVTRDDEAVTVDTGAVRAVLPRHGANLVASLWVGGREVARNGHLIARREDRSRFAAEQILREEDFVSAIDTVTVEQDGPVRAVIKITGKHQSLTGARQWLPFIVRLYFFRASPAIRLVHSFIYDGDPEQDFIKGMGLAFAVPFREELQNRHFRFVGDGPGVWRQPVRMLPGYRAPAGPQVTDLYATELEGQRVPNLADLTPRARAALLTVPIWNDAKLTQLGPNSFSLFKRTTDAGSWLHVTDGHRAQGLAMLADVSGGIAIGLRHFWEKHPTEIELSGAASPVGEMKIWFWSPEAEAMDLRRYDTVPHGLSINYEDWKPGWGTPYGIANTQDVTLWALGAVPTDPQLVAMAQAAREAPMLVCTPEYYHDLQVFGHWSLPDRSTPTLAWLESQIGGLVNFYRDQVDERSWYGFWDFGDIMHNYDFGRHEWRYDVGGWAWANTELMPDMLLWYSFLRTGRPDLFRMAEAMTRQTSEVEVYHLGPFAPLGSRHNVNHWGDGAKQPRISHSGLKQFYYFLTTDERVGDLMHEQLTADLTYERLKPYNGSHYVPTASGGAQLESGGRLGPPPPAPRPENLPPRPLVRTEAARAGLEWMCYAMNWMMEWQRTGDVHWRDQVIGDMRAMAKGLKPGDRLPGSYFDMIFGGPENMYEMEPMFDVPEFWRAWTNTSEAVGRQVNGGQMTGPRMLAYAAYKKHSAELGRLAWDKLIGPALPPVAVPQRVSGPGLLKPVTDPAFLGAPVDWQLHGVASVQWALNAIETLQFAKAYLPDWEAEHGVPASFAATAAAPQPALGRSGPGLSATGRPIEVYLIAGQSNATGQGYVRNLPADFAPNPEVLLYHSGAPHLRGTGPADTWEALQPASESPDRFGPELSFGNAMAALRPGHTIALIKHAHSGTNLYLQWNPGADAADRAHWGDQFATFVATVQTGLGQLRAQGYAPVIRGLIWLQGESDGDKGLPVAEAYGVNLRHFIVRVREQFNAPDLVFVYGYLFDLPEMGLVRRLVIQGERDVAAEAGGPLAVPGAYAVVTQDLTRRGDDPGTPYPTDRNHFSSAGMLEVGRRMAAAMAAHLPIPSPGS